MAALDIDARNAEGVEENARIQRLTGETRNALLVVASVIAAASLRAAIQPPGGLVKNSYKSLLGAVSPRGYLFLLYSNGLAFCTAMALMYDLTCDLPMFRQGYTAMSSLSFLVGAATGVLAPDSIRGKSIVALAILPPLTTLFLHGILKLFCKIKSSCC